MATLDQEEFRALFAQEAEMRLSHLGQLMLELERNGSDDELIGSIFREVHTLKGAAAVVGFEDVSRVAHALEKHLEDLRSGICPVTPELVDALLIAVDGLTVLTSKAVAGEDQGSEAEVFEQSIHAAVGRFTRGSRPRLPGPRRLHRRRRLGRPYRLGRLYRQGRLYRLGRRTSCPQGGERKRRPFPPPLPPRTGPRPQSQAMTGARQTAAIRPTAAP